MLRDITKNFYIENQDIIDIDKLQAVLENIHNILAIEPGEMPMSDKGTYLRKFLFMPINTFVASEIIYEIEQSLLWWESTIEDLEVIVYPKPSENTFQIEVFMKITNIDDVVKYELNLDKIRSS